MFVMHLRGKMGVMPYQLLHFSLRRARIATVPIIGAMIPSHVYESHLMKHAERLKSEPDVTNAVVFE